MIAQAIREIEGQEVACGTLDITLYRDDLTQASALPQVSATELPFSVTDKRIILVDDVIFTGRTARAAIEAVIRARPAGSDSAGRTGGPRASGTAHPPGLCRKERTDVQVRSRGGQTAGI